jgi:hypothetical protein
MKAYTLSALLQLLLDEQAEIQTESKQPETKVWTPDVIQKNIATDAEWTTRALVALYHKQTEAEKSTSTTDASNKVGFSSFDARLLSSFAEQTLRGRPLSQKQLEIVRKRLIKYMKQLTKIANKEL